jgi:DNA-binding transcriptional ArsR family regulator
MRAAAALALVALGLLVTPFVTADFGADSTLEANDPILLDGRADTAYVAGVVSFVSSSADPALQFTLKATEVTLNETAYAPQPCASSGVPLGSGCAADAPKSTLATLRDAEITLVSTTGPYKVAISNNRTQGTPSASFGAPGSLVATTGASTVLGTSQSATHLSAYDADWSSSTARAPGEPFYAADASAPEISTTNGGSVSAAQGLRVLLQGVKVHVAGTSTADGKPVSEDRDLASTSSSTRFLVVDATGADLAAQSAAPFTGFGVAIADVHGSAELTHVGGHATVDGKPYSYDSNGDLPLPGPVSLGIVKVKPGSPARIEFTVSSTLRVLAPPKPDARSSTASLVAAGAAGAGGAGLLAGLIYFWPRLRFAATALLLPLYSRIERTEVLEHQKRDEIYELIRATPGIHAHEIGEKALIGWGTTVYHLKLLESHGLVVSKKSGRYKRFFVNTGEYTKKKDVYGALRNETAKRVAEFIVEHPGSSQKELCAAVGIQPSLASWHVEKLEGVGLVKRVKDGRQVRYFAGPAWSELNVQITPQGADTPAET